ncbi:MAG TPA: DUF1850 domain-containing protein [Thiobacillus sp.]
MSGLCLGIAMSMIQAVIPSDTVVLTWQHSVEKVGWTERYQREADHIRLTEATIKGTGAGMEPPADAVFDGTVWRYTPTLPSMKRFVLTRSTFTADYRVCWNGTCRTLTEIVGPLKQEGEPIELFPCP